MNFEEFIRLRGFDPAAITEDIRAMLEAEFKSFNSRNIMVSENTGFRAFAVAPKTFNEENRSFEAVLTTDEPTMIYDWDVGFIKEVLPIETGEFPERMPLLDSHQMGGGIKNILGSCLNLRAKAAKRSELVSDIQLSDDDDGEKALKKAKGGHLTDLSIGYQVFKAKYLKDGEEFTLKANGKTYKGPMKIALKWAPFEGSLCPIGADKFAKIRSAKLQAPANQQQKVINSAQSAATKSQEANAMTFSMFLRSIGIDEAALTEAQKIGLRALYDAHCKSMQENDVIPESVRQDAAKLMGSFKEAEARGIRIEQERQVEIRSMCADQGLENEFVEKLITEKTPVSDARKMVLEELKRQRSETVRTPKTNFEGGETEGKKLVRAAIDGIAMRHGVIIKAPAAGAGDFRGRSILRIAEECLSKAGVNTRNLSNDEIARRAMATGDFPIILSGVSNLVLAQAYDMSEETWRDIVEINNDVSDFKDITVANIGGAPVFSEILENGSYKAVTFNEIGESYKIKTFGCEGRLTRQMIVNDSLAAYLRWLESFVEGADKVIGNGVYGILTTNGTTETLGDGTSNNLFSAAHGNLISNADALGIDGMKELRLKFRKMKGIVLEDDTQDTLNIRLDRIIVPSELEEQARILTSNENMVVDGVVIKNTSYGTQLTVEDRLSSNSEVNYYGAARRKAIQVAFLNGQQRPEIVRLNSRNPDNFEVMARIDVGWAPIDHRYLVKAAVE